MTPTTDRFRAELIELVDRVAQSTGLRDSGISRAFSGSDSAFVKRLRTGESFTTASAARFEAWLRSRLHESTQPSAK